MWQFFKYVFATITGLFLFFIVGFFLFIGIAAALSSGSGTVSVKDNTVLKLNLNRTIQENKVEEDPFTALFGNDEPTPTSLIQLKEVLHRAKTDKKIKGIYLEAGYPMAGWASLEEVRDALIDFKQSKKFVYSYAEVMGDKGYYLASVADKVYITPQGGLEFDGLRAEYPFLKGLFDKLDIKAEIFRVGEYKSAVEPFFKTEMSPESREQTKDYLTGITNHAFSKIAESKNIPLEKLHQIANGYLARTPAEAQKLGLISQAGYEDEFEAMLRKTLGFKENEKINYVGLNDYLHSENEDQEDKHSDKVAVIIADGEIVSGSSEDGVVASENFVKELRQARKSKSVKAIVVRINSPGGSALASDVMWREIQIAKKEKPVVASISDLGTSGGYYMAMGCDAIVAHPTSIMSNIGVFGVIFNMEKMLSNKLGITFDGVKTHELADFVSGTRTMTEAEKALVQKDIENIYATFTEKAAAGRKMDVEKLRSLARGRVWTGKQSVEKGLADKLGGLEVAVALAAEKAKLKKGDYDLKYYPTPKSTMERFFSKAESAQETRALQAYFGDDAAKYAKYMRSLRHLDGVQARLPYLVEIK